MPMSDAAARIARPRKKTQKITDPSAIFFELAPAGGNYWRMKYCFDGDEKRIMSSVYLDVLIAQACKRCSDARKHLANRVDAGVLKQVGMAATGNRFEALARMALQIFAGLGYTPRRKVHPTVGARRIPLLATRPIGEIYAPELLALLRRIEARDALSTAHRVHQKCGRIFRYAVATCRAQRDSSNDLRRAIPHAQEHHHPTITEPKRLGELLRAIVS